MDYLFINTHFLSNNIRPFPHGIVDKSGLFLQKVLKVTKDGRKQIVADELSEMDTERHAVMNMSCSTPNNQGKG